MIGRHLARCMPGAIIALGLMIGVGGVAVVLAQPWVIGGGGVDAGVVDAGVVDAAPAVDAAATPPLLAAYVDAPPTPSILAAYVDAGVAVGPAPVPVPLDSPSARSGRTEPPPVTLSEPRRGESKGPTTTPPAPASKSNTLGVIKLLVGFLALFVAAYIGSNRKLVRMQQRAGISGLIAAGFPFVALGVIVRQPEVGILTQDVLDRMQPILHFGLGWLGFIIGAQLDIRVLDRVPRGTAYMIVVEALVPFAATAAACGGLAVLLHLGDWRDNRFWRDLILIGAAAAMTAPRQFRGFANLSWREGKGIDHLLAQLDEIVGVVGLLFVAAYFRPTGTFGWDIPGTAWLFVTIGLGVVVGVLIFAMVRVPTSQSEFLAVLLGSVALGAGLAGYLYLSPIVVCFIAGALVTNFPCEQRDQIFRILNHLERPIHLLFLIVAGASWSVSLVSPWLLVPAFVIARVLGKWLGVFAARKTVGMFLPEGFADQRVMVSSLSPLSIALVLSSYGAGGSDWIITVVLGGAILTEVAVQLTAPPTPRSLANVGHKLDDVPEAIDELDVASGPAYLADDDEPAGPAGGAA